MLKRNKMSDDCTFIINDQVSNDTKSYGREKLFSIKNKSRCMIIMISIFMFGFCAHGMALLNLYSHHDNMNNMFDEPEIYLAGRWMLTVLRELYGKIFGYKIPLLPLINGLASFFYISVIVYLYADILGIKRKYSLILLSGLFVTFPVVTSEFGYMFTAPYHFFGTMIGVIGYYMYAKKKNKSSFALCIVLIAASIGVYQINFFFCLGMMLLCLINDIYRETGEKTWKQHIKRFLPNIAIFILSAFIYFCINLIYLYYRNAQMNSYKDNFLKTDLKSYVLGIGTAYKEFLFPTINKSNVYPYHSRWIYIGLIGITITMSIMYVYRINDKKKKILLFTLFLCIPIVSHMVYIAFEPESVHSLMVFPFLMIFIYLIWLIEIFDTEMNYIRILKALSIMGSLFLIVFWINLANVCYLKTELIQDQTIGYCTTLMTRIQMTEGYTERIPVVYINEREKSMDTIANSSWPIEIYLTPYADNSYINDYVWQTFMERWCGFNPLIGDSGQYINDERVEQMPSYPADGSIQIIDGNLIVKF